MKRIEFFSVLLSVFFVLVCTSFSHAQPVMKEKAKNVINRTSVVVYAAHKYTIANQVYTGNLKKAVVHQQIAISLYNDGKYVRAIHQSRRARELARLQIDANSGQYPPGFEPGSDESPDGIAPTNEELDAEADSSTLSATTPGDKELAAQPLTDIEITE